MGPATPPTVRLKDEQIISSPSRTHGYTKQNKFGSGVVGGSDGMDDAWG